LTEITKVLIRQPYGNLSFVVFDKTIYGKMKFSKMKPIAQRTKDKGALIKSKAHFEKGKNEIKYKLIGNHL